MTDDLPNGPKRELATPLFATACCLIALVALILGASIFLTGRTWDAFIETDPQP